MGGGEAALALLRDEFLDDDVESKRRAAERVDLVARALGPEAARTELLPWMTESLPQQEDEILFIFAKKCATLLELVGGKDHVDSLLPVLEGLLAVEETFVREAAVECAQRVIGDNKDAAIKAKLTQVVARLSKSEWFTSRMSACALCGPLLENKPSAEDAKALSELFYAMCRDETPMVRRAAAKEVGAVCRSSTGEEVASAMIPVFNKLSSDPQESVSLNWIGVLGDIAAALSEEQNIEHVLPIAKQFGSDRSWRVRHSVAQNMSKLCSSMHNDAARGGLLPLFCELLRDPEGEVRNVASAHVVAVCAAVGADAFVANVIPVVGGLVEMDQQRTVRLNLANASVSSTLVSTLGAAQAKAHLVPLWEYFLKDTTSPCAPEARLVILDGLDAIIAVLGAAFVAKSWTPILMELFEASRRHNGGDDGRNAYNPLAQEEIEYPQWRIRISVIHTLGKLAGSGEGGVDKLVVDVWTSSLSDEVFQVRLTAANVLETFCEPSSPVGPNKVASLFVPHLVDFFKQAKQKFHHRIVFVHAFGALLRSGSGPAESLFPSFEKCLDDKVPNVRFAALSVLRGIDSEAFKESFAKQLKALCNDPDADVSAEAKAAVERLGL